MTARVALGALLGALLLAAASAQAPCPAGTFSASGLDTNNGGGAGCAPCAAASYSSAAGAQSCTSCPAGISTGRQPACAWSKLLAGYSPTCPTGGCASFTTLAAAQAACLLVPTCGAVTSDLNGPTGWQLRLGPGVLPSATGEMSYLIMNQLECRGAMSIFGSPATTGSTSVAACAVCAPGFAGTVTGAGTAGAAGCVACAAGTYAPANAGVCIACPAGTYSAAGASACTACPVGITTTGGVAGGVSVANCTLCAPGYAGTVTGSGTSGAAGCSACAAGSYAGAGQASCTSCASGGAAASAAAATACRFQTSSLLLLRVGDGVACPSPTGLAACSWTTAPMYLDEYNAQTGVKVQTIALPASLSMGASEPFTGALSRCGDGSCVVLGGAVAAPPGTVGAAAVPYFPFPRPVVRVSASGAVDASTQLPYTLYNGLVKGACSIDGSGYWVAGNTTTLGMVYVPHGAQNLVRPVGMGVFPSFYTGCTAVTEPSNALYFDRAQSAYGFIDYPTPQAQDWTSPMYVSGTTGSWSISSSYYFKQMLTSWLQDKFWGASTDAAYPMPRTAVETHLSPHSCPPPQHSTLARSASTSRRPCPTGAAWARLCFW